MCKYPIKNLLSCIAFLACLSVLLYPSFCLGGESLFEEASYGKGHLSIRNGVPVLYLAGTPREIGAQYGHLLKDQIRHVIQAWLRPMYPGEGDWEKAVAEAKALEPFIPEPYVQEMKAAAGAAGMDYEAILVAHTFTETSRMDYMFFCSGVIAFGPATGDGRCYHARNFDFPSRGVITPGTIVMVYHPEGKIPFASIGAPVMMGVVSGLNDKGISLSTNYIIGWPKGGGIPQMMLYRKIMEESHTLDTAVAVLKQAKRSGANIMLIASADNGMVCEYTRDRVEIRRAENGLVYATNHFRKIKKPSGCDRFLTISDMVGAQSGKINLARPRWILRSTALGRLNCQAMIFEPGAKAIHVAITDTHPAAEGPYKTLTAKELFETVPADFESRTKTNQIK